jgi:hypothetical protein
MSKMSAKQRVTQLMEWIPTMKFSRKKLVKTEDTTRPTTRRPASSYNVKIKNM